MTLKWCRINVDTMPFWLQMPTEYCRYSKAFDYSDLEKDEIAVVKSDHGAEHGIAILSNFTSRKCSLKEG